MLNHTYIQDEKLVDSTPLYHRGVGIEHGKYGAYSIIDRKSVFVPHGGAVGVEGCLTDIDTLENAIVLLIPQDGGTIRYVMEREKLNETELLKLQKYAVQVGRKSAPILLQVIENLTLEAEKKLIHSVLGFGAWNGKPIFKGYQSIGVDSNYYGVARIEPHGSFEEWLDLIRTEVVGWTPLEFVLSASISGLLVDYIKEEISCENVLVHLIGNSSTGKTTAGLLAVSCGCAPDFKDNTFVFNFSSTCNSLMKLIPSSFPCLIDEGSLIPDEKNLTNFLYSLSSGLEKKRLSNAMTVGESCKFRTVVFFSSEKSILAQCNQNSGLLVRNFEFVNVVWTQSAESSDRIKEVISQNYGHLIPRVAEWLLKQDKQAIAERVRVSANEVIERAKVNGTFNPLTERTAKQMALVLVSVDILQELLQLGFDREKILDFMEKHSLVNDTEQVSIGKRAMEWTMQYIVRNKLQFRSEDVSEVANGCKGRLQHTKSYFFSNNEESTLTLYMAENEFKKMLREGGFSEPKVVLKEWKECGYLNAQKDRYISRIKVDAGLQIQGYIIRIPTTTFDMLTDDGFEPIEKALQDETNRQEIEKIIEEFGGVGNESKNTK